MKSTLRIYHRLLSLSVLLVFFSCSFLFKDDKEKPEPDNDNIKTGTEVQVSSMTIPSSGSDLVIGNGGTPIDGMKISVPSGSYGISRTFSVSYVPIESHNLGEYFNPITPLIKISNGGGYSDSVMTVTIPINVPTGEFAMAFAFDEQTGKLEGLPLVDYKNNTLTIGTRHFSTAEANGSAKLAPMQSQNSFLSLVVSSIKESVLQGKPMIASGFVPGTDDWEFTNWGSWIADGGHCAGQAMSALWYYYTYRLNGGAKLFGLLDNTTALWQDNPKGYKFASTIQEDFNFDGWVNSLTIQSYLDVLTFKAFAVAILLSGEPQSVLIRNSAGQGGHAMIVHKVDYNGGILYISDPNYPGNVRFSDKQVTVRKIELVNNNFNAYPIGLTAGGNTIMMDQIGYAGKTSYIEWPQIAKRWTEVQNGTIGNDRFPECRCSLLIKDSIKWKAILKDTIQVEKDTFKLKCSVILKNDPTIYGGDLQVYRDGAKIANKAFTVDIISKPGNDKLGVWITAPVTNVTDTSWIDFKNITFRYGNLKIEPYRSVGAKDAVFDFEAQSGGTVPVQARYEWDFGDGSNKYKVKNDSTSSHKYTKEGNFTVELQVFDDSNNKLFAEAEAFVEVTSGDLQIVSIQPQPAATGDTIRISGYGFGNGSDGYAYLYFTHERHGEAKIGYASNSEYIISWTDSEIKVAIPQSTSTGDIQVKVLYPTEKLSNKFKLMVKPKIDYIRAYDTGGYAEARTYKAYYGPDVSIYGSGLVSYTSQPIVTIGGRSIFADSISFGSHIQIENEDLPDDLRSGDIVVTVEGISSNAVPLKVGVEDWAQMTTIMALDPAMSMTIKCANTGDVRSESYKPFNYDNYLGPPNITWSGTNFSVDYTGENRWLVVKYSGSLNEQGTMLTSLKYYKEIFHNDTSFTIWEFECSNIPLSGAHHLGSVAYNLKGSDIQSHVTKVRYQDVYDDYKGIRNWNIESVVWEESSTLTLRFSKKDNKQ